ncbi:MAG: ATP-binding protein [Chloroflexota bacterium]
MKITRSLNSRLVLSHLAVSLVSIIAMAVFMGRYIFQAATSETEHNLQGLAYAAGNALELPIQEVNQGKVQVTFLKELLSRMFADSPEMEFTVYKPDGFALVDSSDTLPPRANRYNAPEVVDALESDVGRGISIRDNGRGTEMINMAVLIQREIEVTGIVRLSIPFAPTQQSARQAFLLLLFVALVVASLVSLVGWYLARTLARPLQILTMAAEHMEHGDLGVRVKPSGPEEFRRLTEAFNNMASRLQTNVNELRAFVANASHELRTPLTVVKLRTEALREGALEDQDIAIKFLTDIETEVDRLVRMVNDLLDLSRLEAGLVGSKRSLMNLRSIAHEVFETFNIRAQRASVNLSLDVEPGLGGLLGNEDQLRRVFYNLVENAIKYTPAGGQVEVLLRAGPNPNTLRMLVRDTGPGIPPEHLPHVFERFYRAETTAPKPGAVRGSGLGLAIAKSIVESHGGEIGVSSQVGNGTTFWVDLPVTAAFATGAAPASTPAAPSA